MILSTGVDVELREDAPDRNLPDKAYSFISGTEDKRRRILLKFAKLPEQVFQRTVLSATLSGHVKVGGTHTVEVAALATGFTESGARWGAAGGPAVSSSGAVSQSVSTADGGRWSLDVTALVQRVANGTAYYGWRIATSLNGSRSYFMFETNDSWTLTLELAADNDAPVSLSPDGGSVGLAQPTLGWTIDDPDPEDGEGVGAQVAYQVQVASDSDFLSVAYDSGEQTSTLSEHPLVGTGYSLPSGADRFWRVRIKDAAAQWSEWSDPAEVVYRPYPSLSWVAPSGDTITDPSPVLQVQLSSGVAVASQAFVFDAAEGVRSRYDSGRVDEDAALVTHTVPESSSGSRVFAQATGSYRLRVQVEDREDRVACSNPTTYDPGYLTVEKVVTFASGPAAAPVSLTVEQPGAFPEARLRFTRSEAPDGWVFERSVAGGAWTVVGRVEADETLAEDGNVVAVGPGVWTWTDATAPAGRALRYRVRAVVNAAQSAPSAAAEVTLFSKGFWLLRLTPSGHPTGERACIPVANYSNVQQSESSAKYTGIGAQRGYSIVYALRGLAGSVSGTVSRGDFGSVEEFEANLATLRAIRAARTEVVRAVWLEHNVPVEVSNMSNVGGEEYRPNNREHAVTFELEQTGEFE